MGLLWWNPLLPADLPHGSYLVLPKHRHRGSDRSSLRYGSGVGPNGPGGVC